MNTNFLLLAEFGTGSVPLVEVAKKYFSHEVGQMQSWARAKKYPFPIYRLGGNRSEWMVSVGDLAQYIDSKRDKAAEERAAMGAQNDA